MGAGVQHEGREGVTRLADAVSLGLLAGVLSLDRVAFLQTMASRPLVASSLAGLVLGDGDLGLRCGLVLELLWLMDLPVGAWVPPDDLLVAVLAVAFAAAAPPSWGRPACVALSVLCAVPFGVLGRAVDVWVRRRNATLLAKARADETGASLGALHWTGAAYFCVAGALAAGFGAWGGGVVIQALAPRVAGGFVVGLEWSAALFPLVGTAAVLAALRGRAHTLWFGVGLLGGLGASGFAGSVKVPWLR